MVELVDTLGSGSSSRKGVGVRVSPSAPQERETSAMQIADVFYLCPAAGAGRDPVEKDCQACAKARTLCAILCEMPCGGLPRDALRPISVGQNAASEKRKKVLAKRRAFV